MIQLSITTLKTSQLERFCPYTLTTCKKIDLRTRSVVKVKGTIQEGVLKAYEVEFMYHDMEGLALNIPTTGIRPIVFENANSTGNTLGLNLRSCSKGRDIASSNVIVFGVNLSKAQETLI